MVLQNDRNSVTMPLGYLMNAIWISEMGKVGAAQTCTLNIHTQLRKSLFCFCNVDKHG